MTIVNTIPSAGNQLTINNSTNCGKYFHFHNWPRPSDNSLELIMNGVWNNDHQVKVMRGNMWVTRTHTHTHTSIHWCLLPSVYDR